jgi:hypothetical protein
MEMHIVPIAYMISDQYILLLPPFQPVALITLLRIPFLSLPTHTSKREAGIWLYSAVAYCLQYTGNNKLEEQ